MGFLDRLLGREEPQQPGYDQRQQGYGQPQNTARPATPAAPQRSDDEIAVERYRYLLRTAPPERIEEVHAEAFATLTPEQRRMVYDEFTRSAPAGEAPRGDDPRSLAQSATRSELRQPGYMERSLGGLGGGGRRLEHGEGSRSQTHDHQCGGREAPQRDVAASVRHQWIPASWASPE